MPLDQPPAVITFNSGPAIQVLNLHYHGELFEVMDSGEVLISWKNIEATAADPETDRIARSFALMFIAARDRTDKPLPDHIP